VPVDIPQSDITVMGIVKAKLEPKKAKTPAVPKPEPKIALNFDLGICNAFPEDYTDTADNFLSVKITDHKEGQCRWPSEGVTDITYCGCPSQLGSMYCERHNRRGTKAQKPMLGNKKVWR
jgi:hypothetical protein